MKLDIVKNDSVQSGILKVWHLLECVLFVGVMGVIVQISQPCQAANGISKSTAYSLILQQFMGTFDKEAIRHLEIKKIVQKVNSKIEVTYSVIVEDRRDVSFPARNHMEATAGFVNLNGTWHLQGLNDMKQYLEFLVAE